MNLWFKQIIPYLVLVIFHLNSGQVDNQAAPSSRDQPAKLPQAYYCPPGAPFGPVHFTEYLPNLAYSKYGLETILIANLLARTRSTKYIGRKGKRIKILSLLFKDKYNYLPVYFVPMTPPLTPRLNRPLEPTNTAETTSTQLFEALPASSAAPHPEPSNASTYDWLPEMHSQKSSLSLFDMKSLNNRTATVISLTPCKLKDRFKGQFVMSIAVD
ncbi:hypothetical protein DSO57_1001724 [Entomophthora muscae]|uniref:Uncharacterized protein n=1 Tax=Entomophthora muscae TaxID=34485 RepID=A0ACC2SLM8_9FUNG|nr:hypothetical protein DSO57_1001724 [Entomophthora muscae]